MFMKRRFACLLAIGFLATVSLSVTSVSYAANNWLTGSGSPTSALGTNSDHYLDIDTMSAIALHHAGSQRNSMNYAIPFSRIIKHSNILQHLALAVPPRPVVTPPSDVKPVVGTLLVPKAQAFEPEMVRIPGGTFQMGCVSGKACENDEKPVHSVTVPSFYMGKYEVTVGEYMGCVKAGKCKPPEWQEQGSRFNIKTGSDNFYKKLGSALTYDRHPIVGVSWKDARSYAKWLTKKTGKTYHLPTEAEWEYAARGDRSGNNKTQFGWGNNIGRNRANCGSPCGDKWKFTAPVGSFPSNDFGLNDMHGNVWEWVEDCYVKSYKNTPRDGTANRSGSCGHGVVRGGSWFYGPRDLRSANRNWYSSGGRFNYVGFRLARTLNAKR